MQPMTTAQCSDNQDYYGVRALSARELRRRKRELAARAGLASPPIVGCLSGDVHLAAVDAELGTRRIFECAYLAREDQVSSARHAVKGYLAGCPRVDDAIMITSELATNAVLHSASRHGGTFTVRAELHRGLMSVEAEDAGGPWRERPAGEDDEHPHGLAIIGLLSGDSWGVEDVPGGRLVWAELAIR
jgi:anti-sigma regulatory factor (Ser/Thr protein kinase)